MNSKILTITFFAFFMLQSSVVGSQFQQNDFYPADNVYAIYSVSFGGSPMVSIINTTKSDNLTDVNTTGFINIQNPQSAIISINYTHTDPYLLEKVWSETKNASQSYTYSYASYINTTTRNYVTGIFKNSTTPGYIDPRNVNTNDTLNIQGSLYNVTKIGSITLSSNITRNAIWVVNEIDPNLVKIWYDKETGLMLKLEFNLTYTNTFANNMNFKLMKQTQSGLKIQELYSTNAFSTTPTSKTADVPIFSIFIALVSIWIYKRKRN